MKHKSSIIFIGWINYGQSASCGETIKNQLCIQRLKDFGVKCYLIDFYQWSRHPWIFIQLLWFMLIHKKSTLVFSTSFQNVYPMVKLMKCIRWKQKTVHWVIGGSFGQKVKDGTYRADVAGYIDWTLVESKIMMEQLRECGLNQVLKVSNFKPITYYPPLSEQGEKLRFVFLSRIMPEKGCDYILKAAKILNESGFSNSYEIDFYGTIAETYKDEFERKVVQLPNVRYAGFLNLREKEGYDTLASYDAMLFPTYWEGEGFAGVFIDTYIAGVPMIATEWAHNRQFMEEGKTALFIPVHDVTALANKMRECIEGKHNLHMMSKLCQQEAEKYKVNNVITEVLLKKIGI